MPPLNLRRLGTIMVPKPNCSDEVEGVLNPAAARAPDGNLFLFPGLVAKGNYSRIGIARVKFNSVGDPTGVERIGPALEPEADYERGEGGTGECEDPRATYVEELRSYVMTYVALSTSGPWVSYATSKDLLHWERQGLVNFAHFHDVDFDNVDDKDASFFPNSINGPSSIPGIAILHRPHFRNEGAGIAGHNSKIRSADLDRKSVWISYRHTSNVSSTVHVGTFTSHCPPGSTGETTSASRIGTISTITAPHPLSKPTTV